MKQFGRIPISKLLQLFYFLADMNLNAVEAILELKKIEIPIYKTISKICMTFRQTILKINRAEE